MATSSRKITGGNAGGVMAYLKDANRTLAYYSDGQTVEGFGLTWGNLAPDLGVQNGISEEQWAELFVGKWAGERVTRDGNRVIRDETGAVVDVERAHTNGIDIMFSVPKGISELYVRAASQDDADDISNAVMTAAKVAWHKAVQDHARVARVRDGGEPVAHTADLLCTPVMQFTARPTDATIERGSPADPHLHVHAFTFAAGKVDGRWYTIDEAGIKRTAEYRDSVFMNELSRNIEALGYDLDYSDFDMSRKGKLSFEPSESTDDLRLYWSTNHTRSLELARQFEVENNRPPTNLELDYLMKTTRSSKMDKDFDARPVREIWQTDAANAGYDVSPVHPYIWGKPMRPPNQAELHRRLMTSKGLLREGAAVNGNLIRPAIARCAVGLGFSYDQLLDYEVAFRKELIVVRPAVEDAHQLYTTQEHLDREDFITQRRTALGKPRYPSVPSEAIRHAIGRQKVDLDREQWEAVKLACSSSGWVHITGEAGTGKSVSAKAIVDAHRLVNNKTRVVAVAVAAKTANDFARKIDADRHGSVESVIDQIKRGKIEPDRDTIILIDEAAMMDTFRMSELLKHTGRARVVLIGDDAQLTPIGAAGWYAESVDCHGVATLTRVHRHRDAADTEAYRLIRQQRGQEAVADLQGRGRVHVSDDRSERLGKVMDDYRVLRDERGYKAAQIRQVIETSNHDVDLMNRFVQRDRLARGEISRAHFKVTDTEQDRQWTLHQGDQIIFLKSWAERGKMPVRNGSTGFVRNVSDDGDITISLGDRTVSMRLDARAHNQTVGLAYAQHAAKLQGGEVEQVQVMPSPATATSNSGYSQVTRAKHEAHIYLADADTPQGVDSVHALGEAWSTTDEVRTANSYLAEDTSRPVEWPSTPAPKRATKPVPEPAVETSAAPVRTEAATESPARAEMLARIRAAKAATAELEERQGEGRDLGGLGL